MNKNSSSFIFSVKRFVEQGVLLCLQHSQRKSCLQLQTVGSLNFIPQRLGEISASTKAMPPVRALIVSYKRQVRDSLPREKFET